MNVVVRLSVLRYKNYPFARIRRSHKYYNMSSAADGHKCRKPVCVSIVFNKATHGK